MQSDLGMYDFNDTIAAIASGKAAGARTIIRIAGGDTFEILSRLVSIDIKPTHRRVESVRIKVSDDNFTIPAKLYTFCAPDSYTGGDICEIHLTSCGAIVAEIFAKLIALGPRTAEPGEFTYRAYINGKLDLSQAEAVAEIVSSSNRYQLNAAEKLLTGKLTNQLSQIREKIIELCGLIEAGLDFCDENIEFISTDDALIRAGEIAELLKEVLAGSVSFEQIIAADAVAVAGLANAGKSSLVNSIAGVDRSIVSDKSGATRDVLEHWVQMEKCDCVLFDCAGLSVSQNDELSKRAQTIAVEALNYAAIMIFCVDISLSDYKHDIEILKQLDRTPEIFVATKSDTADKARLGEKLAELKKVFGKDFLPASSETSVGIDDLKDRIQDIIVSARLKSTEAGEKVAITKRHLEIVTNAIETIGNAANEITAASGETAVMYLRMIYENLSGMGAEHLDEAVLEKIFSTFCVGK